MKFLSLLAALLLEQMRPLRQGNPIQAAFERYASALERQLNAGQHFHGAMAWLLAAVPVALVTIIVSCLAGAASPILAWAWSIGILYLTMGFRQFSHYFTEIIRALREGDETTARQYIARWRGESAAELTPAEVARVSIELALVGAHRHVFGPIAWFAVLGPAGAIIYRMAAILAEKWGPSRAEPEFGEFGLFAQRFFFWYDWIPVRLTAASFAIVGNFEDAIYSWRTQAIAWAARGHGIILASGAGALGVRLGGMLRQGASAQYRPELGLGDEADVDYMQSAVGLIWRALVLWMFLLFIITVAHSLG